MKNTTTWNPRGHEEIIKAVREMLSGLSNSELSTLLGMGNNGALAEWKTKVLMPAISELLSAYTAWEPLDERTLKMTTRLEDAEVVVLPLCECVAGVALWNPLVTNIQLETLGLPPRRPGEKPKPAPVMNVAPWYKLVESAIRTVVVEYGDAESGAKRKPAGQQGAECRYLLSKTPPVPGSPVPRYPPRQGALTVKFLVVNRNPIVVHRAMRPAGLPWSLGARQGRHVGENGLSCKKRVWHKVENATDLRPAGSSVIT
jgi:hypothetical protein